MGMMNLGSVDLMVGRAELDRALGFAAERAHTAHRRAEIARFQQWQYEIGFKLRGTSERGR